MLHTDITRRIIGAFYTVYNELGYGFLEKVYEAAMLIELAEKGLQVRGQAEIRVQYRDRNIGKYFADLLVEERVIVELKAASALCPEHEAQLLNYLKATEIEVGLLLNFGPEAKFIRKILANSNK